MAGGKLNRYFQVLTKRKFNFENALQFALGQSLDALVGFEDSSLEAHYSRRMMHGSQFDGNAAFSGGGFMPSQATQAPDPSFSPAKVRSVSRYNINSLLDSFHFCMDYQSPLFGFITCVLTYFCYLKSFQQFEMVRTFITNQVHNNSYIYTI